MANYVVTDQSITSVANAIRTKGGTSDILHWPNEFVSAIQNIPTGGGGGSTDGDVIFIDYDGSVVTAKTKAEINAMTSDSDLPANPSHTGLTAQGWNWTVAKLKTQLTAMPEQKIYVGQMYITASGATEIDIELVDDLALSPYLCICVNGSATIDWGDNSETDTVTGTSTSTRKYTQHVYSTTGNYTISITVNSGKFRFYVSVSYPILSDKNSSSQYLSKIYSSSVKRIRLGGNVDSDSIFREHYSIESITIPSSVTSIGSSAFKNCYSLKSVTIPSGVTSIGSNAFEGCYSLTSVTIPSSVTSFGSSAFLYCYSLESITIPSSITSIGDSAFSSYHPITGVTIPSGVTSFGSNAFAGCYALTSVTIKSGVTSIGSNAFQNCYALKSVTIPSSVTSFESYAFASCYALTSITIPSGVTSIGNSAFAGCYSIASVTIPSSVTSIGNSTFQNCYAALAYHFQRTTPPTLGTTAFSGIKSDCVIYVPYSADHSVLNAYKGETNWSTYASYMQEEPAP